MYVDLTIEHRKNFAFLKEKAGCGLAGLFKNRQDMPHGFRAQMVQGWIKGQVTRARIQHIEYAQKILNDAENISSLNSVVLIPVDDIRLSFLRERERTGLNSNQMMMRFTDAPADFKKSQLDNIVNGTLKNIPQNVADYILMTLSTIPDAAIQELGVRQGDYMEITQDMREALNKQHLRTKIGGVTLLKNDSKKPKSLRGGMIGHWVSGRTKIIKIEHYNYVLEKWLALDDCTE